MPKSLSRRALFRAAAALGGALAALPLAGNALAQTTTPQRTRRRLTADDIESDSIRDLRAIYQPQRLIMADDLDSNDIRSLRISDIHESYPPGEIGVAHVCIDGQVRSLAVSHWPGVPPFRGVYGPYGITD